MIPWFSEDNVHKERFQFMSVCESQNLTQQRLTARGCKKVKKEKEANREKKIEEKTQINNQNKTAMITTTTEKKSELKLIGENRTPYDNLYLDLHLAQITASLP